MSNFQSTQHGSIHYGHSKDSNQAYIRRGPEDWTPLLSPSSFADFTTTPFGQKAREGPFTWHLKSDIWTLQRVDFGSSLPVPTSAAEEAEKPSLYLVLESQAPGEPNHWLLFFGREDDEGDVYQVQGDAENMAYQPETQINVFRKDVYKTCYVLARDLDEEQERTIERVARNEGPPKAENRAAVRENCQGWAWRVLRGLVPEGVVATEKVEMVRGLVEDIY